MAIDGGKVINVVLAGLGGQGVLKASDILAGAAFRGGFDVKKAEIHGMSQRGGSVASDVRFGTQVDSPMIPRGEADFLVVLADDQVDNNRHVLAADGTLIATDVLQGVALSNRRSANVAMLGVLSSYLPIEPADWIESIKENLSAELHEMNVEAFESGRQLASV